MITRRRDPFKLVSHSSDYLILILPNFFPVFSMTMLSARLRIYIYIYIYFLLLLIWLALLASKMTQIQRCDWLPELARWSRPALSGLTAVSRKKNFPESHMIIPLLTKFVRSRWLDIGLVLLFFAGIWTLTSSRSINAQKKNLANMQPS